MTSGLGGGERDLRTGQYASDARLAARIRLHQTYSVSPESWYAWLHARCGLDRFGAVLDVGCGNGAFWKDAAARRPDVLTLCDLSSGMLRAAGDVRAARLRSVQASVARLPFPSDSFEAALANHMLYHAEDVGAALLELHRVLRPGAPLFASTVGPDHLRELESLRLAAGLARERPVSMQAFDLASGARAMGERFTAVAVHRFPNHLEVTDPGAVVDYVASSSDLTARQAEQIRARVASEIADRGFFHVTIDSGLVASRLAADPGGGSR